MLIKYSGKYIEIYFNLKITFLYTDVLNTFFVNCPSIAQLCGKSGVHILVV